MSEGIRRKKGIYGSFGIVRRKAIALLCFLSIFIISAVESRPAQAQTCPVCALCIHAPHVVIREMLREEHEHNIEHLIFEFMEHRRRYVIGYFFRQHILAAMQSMTEQLITAGMTQMKIIGGFFDAQQQLETQRLLQLRLAEAHKNYRPSTSICTIGTAGRALAETTMSAELTASVMGQRSLQRQMLSVNASSAVGPAQDLRSRVDAFRRYFCDNADANRAVDQICPASAPPIGQNRDVDFMRTVYEPLTIDIDFFDPAPSLDKASVLALANNLFAHEVFEGAPVSVWEQEDKHVHLLDMRSVIAQRSVAEHSFNSIVAMKAAGSGNAEAVGPYLANITAALGVPHEEALFLLGERPSYHALMELLTKKIYQDTNFYVNLYDSPANIQRTGAAIRAIGLMQNMDKFKSQLRNEAMLSVLVELELEKVQDAIQNRLHRLPPER